jgi:phosphohistidine phosphatase
MAGSKVDLIFLRHGLADWPNWGGSDDDRPLNAEGKKETHQVGAFLAALGIEPQKILTSPLPRASQTADIAAEYIKAPIEIAKELSKGFNVRRLEKLLDQKNSKSVMLVGHEPDFSCVIEELTGGVIKLRKSGVARLSLDRKKMKARLHWLLTPATCQGTAEK